MSNRKLLTAMQRSAIDQLLERCPGLVGDLTGEFPGCAADELAETLARRLQLIRIQLSWSHQNMIIHRALPDYFLLLTRKASQPLVYQLPRPTRGGLEDRLLRRLSDVLDQEAALDHDQPLLHLDFDEFTVFLFHRSFRRHILRSLAATPGFRDD